MQDYKSMYFQLFNRITDAIGILQNAQQEAEELYMSAEEQNVMILEKFDTDSNNESKT